jgi:glycopeptide antibiotics resistance protein
MMSKEILPKLNLINFVPFSYALSLLPTKVGTNSIRLLFLLSSSFSSYPFSLFLGKVLYL